MQDLEPVTINMLMVELCKTLFYLQNVSSWFFVLKEAICSILNLLFIFQTKQLVKNKLLFATRKKDISHLQKGEVYSYLFMLQHLTNQLTNRIMTQASTILNNLNVMTKLGTAKENKKKNKWKMSLDLLAFLRGHNSTHVTQVHMHDIFYYYYGAEALEDTYEKWFGFS
ncbi:hypothetical protein ACJX0J_014284, partial [Zea mays]